MGNPRSELDRVRQLHRKAQRDPRSVEYVTEELEQYMRSPSEEVRYYAVDSLIGATAKHPLEYREIASSIALRFDDKSLRVRVAALSVGYHLAGWWVREFSAATDLLHQLTKSSHEKERYLAIVILTKIAKLRPDRVTPRREILLLLDELDLSEFEPAGEEYDLIGQSDLQSAVTALSGGDIHSRELNADLAPTPRSTQFSQPFRAGVYALVMAVFVFILPVVVVLNTARFASQFTSLPKKRQLQAVTDQIRKLAFFMNRQRAILYLRASWWPTPIQILVFFESRTPVSADPTQKTPPYPEWWGAAAKSVYLRDNFQCMNCGADAKSGDVELHADHQMPRSKGGDDYALNLRALCRQCHQARHARIFREDNR